MKCERCNKREASVHVSTFINGQMSQMHICQECMQGMKPMLQGGFSINDLIAGFIGETGASIPARCGRCGLDYNTFKKNGLLGCAQCYKEFKPQLTTMLAQVHGKAMHQGRVPNRAGSVLTARRELERLRRQLSKAVEEENYEEAAQLRDTIRDKEKEVVRSAGDQ